MKILLLAAVALGQSAPAQMAPGQFAVKHTDAEWQKLLPKNSYLILRQAGTEKPYSGAFWDHHVKGTYKCMGCDQALFSSETKFDSHTGWPSFYQQVSKGKTLNKKDGDRTEVLCARCGGHLGHVFDDGPKPTGLRYCINSPALKFVAKKP